MELLDVMLVDDDYLVLQDLQTLIAWEQYGFRIVATATSGETALSLFQKYRPKLVFCDAYMPGMNGLDLVDRLLEIDKNVDVFVVSSYEDFHFARRAVKAGVIEYLLKNEMTPEVLIDKLALVLKKHQSSQKITARMNRILLSDFFVSRRSPEDFMNNTQIEPLDGMRLYQLMQKPSKLIVLFGKLPFFRKPVQSSVELQLGNTIFQSVREQLTGRSKENTLLFYTADAVILDGENTPDKMAEELVQNVQKQGYVTIAIYCETARTLEQFRDYLQTIVDQICFLRMFGTKSVYSIDLLRKWHKIPFSQRMDAEELIRDKPDTELFRTALHTVLHTYFERCDCEGIELVCRTLLNYYEQQCDFNFVYPASVQFDGVTHVEEYLTEGYRQMQQYLQEHRSQNYSKTVMRAIAFVEKNYGDPDLSVEVIAQQVNKSTGRLGVLFKQETGQTVNEFLTEFRIEKAKKFLGGTSLKIYEVATRVGFRSSQYFSKVFLDRTGKRPVDYK